MYTHLPWDEQRIITPVRLGTYTSSKWPVVAHNAFSPSPLDILFQSKYRDTVLRRTSHASDLVPRPYAGPHGLIQTLFAPLVRPLWKI
jgi:hypothetical protein